MTVSPLEVQAIIERASAGIAANTEVAVKAGVESALRQTFRDLGVDLGDQRQVNELRRDLIYMREWRRRCEAFGRHAVIAVITVFVGAALTAMLWGAIHFLNTGAASAPHFKNGTKYD